LPGTSDSPVASVPAGETPSTELIDAGPPRQPPATPLARMGRGPASGKRWRRGRERWMLPSGEGYRSGESGAGTGPPNASAGPSARSVRQEHVWAWPLPVHLSFYPQDGMARFAGANLVALFLPFFCLFVCLFFACLLPSCAPFYTLVETRPEDGRRGLFSRS
jgi:hypothetical protein